MWDARGAPAQGADDPGRAPGPANRRPREPHRDRADRSRSSYARRLEPALQASCPGGRRRLYLDAGQPGHPDLRARARHLPGGEPPAPAAARRGVLGLHGRPAHRLLPAPAARLRRGRPFTDLPACAGQRGLLLSSFTAIGLYRERPGLLGIAGILLVAAGVTMLSLPDGAAALRAGALGYGLMTGMFIAGYTLWDKYAVANVRVPPLLEEFAAGAGVALALAAFAARDRERMSALWRGYRWQVIGTAVLSPLAYILVLTALVFSPVSSIAPAREVSVLFGVLLGRRLLGEGGVARRLTAAAAIAAGVAAIAIS